MVIPKHWLCRTGSLSLIHKMAQCFKMFTKTWTADFLTLVFSSLTVFLSIIMKSSSVEFFWALFWQLCTPETAGVLSRNACMLSNGDVTEDSRPCAKLDTALLWTIGSLSIQRANKISWTKNLCFRNFSCSRGSGSSTSCQVVPEEPKQHLEWNLEKTLASGANSQIRAMKEAYSLQGHLLSSWPRVWATWVSVQFSSVAHSCPTLCEPVKPQHSRLPCPSPRPRACSNSCPSSRWCIPTISSSFVPFSLCLQLFPASGSFPMSQFFASGGQSIGVLASGLVLPMNIQDWFPLGWTGWISLQSKGLSRVFSNTTFQKHQFFGAELSLWSNSYIHIQLRKKP